LKTGGACYAPHQRLQSGGSNAHGIEQIISLNPAADEYKAMESLSTPSENQ